MNYLVFYSALSTQWSRTRRSITQFADCCCYGLLIQNSTQFELNVDFGIGKSHNS